MTISTTKVGKILYSIGAVQAAFTTRDLRAGTVKGVCDETYGRKSHLYIRVDSMASRRAVEAILEREGGKVNRDYSPGSAVVDVQVSYFKGWHWNE